MTDLRLILQKAITLLQAGDFQQSRSLLQPLTGRFPNNADVWQLCAASFRGCGELAPARQAFERSLRINPRQPAVLNNFGNLLREIGELRQAQRCYEKAVALHPAFQDALCNLGIVLSDLDQFQESLKVLERSLALNSSHVPTLFALGNTHQELGDNEAALGCYDRVIAITPGHYRAIHNRALLLKLTGEYEAAIEGFERALSLQPELVECVHNLATAHALLGNREAAEKYYCRVVALAPEDADNHHWLNLFLWATKSDDFLYSYRHELNLRPNNPELWVDWARKLCQAGRPDEARATLEEALEKCDEQPVLLRELSAVLRQLGEPEGVVSLALRARSLSPDDPSILEELGRAYLAEGEYLQALGIFEALLHEDDLNQGWWCMRATALRALRDSRYGELYDYSRFVAPLVMNVPLGYRNMGEFLEELIADIRKYHTTAVHPLDQTLRAGTQSLETLFSRKDHSIQLYKRAVSEQIADFLSTLYKQEGHPLLRRLTGSFAFTDSWSVILKDSGFHKNHFHSAGWFSSACYLQVPPEIGHTGDGSGWIKFGEPELYLPERFDAEYVVKPEAGLLVVFPSYMWHGTNPFRSSTERITAPFDFVPA
jgi:tetratricopeptide (TPR) repeat protein